MSDIGPAVPRFQFTDSIEASIVSAEPKLTIIHFEKNDRGQTFFRIAGMDPEAELSLLMEDLGTENPNVINTLLCDIRRMAMDPDGTLNQDVFHSILAKVRDEKPRTARARQISVQKAALQHLFFERVQRVSHNNFIPADEIAVTGLKVITKLSIELSDAANRERDQSPTQVLNVLNVGEGAPTLVNDASHQQAIEHKPTPALDLECSPNKEDALVAARKAKDAENGLGVVGNCSAAGNRYRPRARYQPKSKPHGSSS